MSVFVDQSVQRQRIDAALQVTPDYLRPVLLAVRDHDCAWVIVPQRSGRFFLPHGKKPLISIIGDDLDSALGPAGFHRKSIRKLIAASRFVAIIASEALALPYTLAASIAVLGRNATIIETRPDQEMQWVALVKAAAPDAQLLISSVKETAQ